MDAALGRLLLLRLRGAVRYRVSQFASLRGAVFLVVIIGIVWLLMGAGTSASDDALRGAALQDPDSLRQHIRNFMPLGMLGAGLFTLFVATGPALYFSPNEINFLFTGPFTRRGLVVYKCCAYFTGAILSAAIITLLIPPRASTGFAAFTGTLLTLLFIQFGSAAIRMLGQAYEGSLLMRARQPAILVAFTIGSLMLLYVTATTDDNIFEVLSTFRHSWLGGIILAPFVVFAELFLAQKIFPDLLAWAAVAIAINAAFLLVIITFDSRCNDRSLAENRRLSKRWLRIRQGASFWASDKTTGRSARRAPVFGGLGPVAWRQAINAVRNSGRVIFVFFAIAVLTGPLVAAAGTDATLSGSVGILYFFIVFVLPRSLVCDFRGELGSIEHYKSLPIAPWRICAGQLVAPVLLCSAIELVMIFSLLPFLDGSVSMILLALTAFTLPSSLLLYGLENLLFLLFPTKLVPVGRVDFEFLGRTLVDFVLKTIIIFAALAVAGLAGWAALRLSGHSWFWFGLTGWLTLSLIGLATIPLLGLAFARFRVSETIELR